MENLRPISMSLAVFVAICFFLPWLQVSCGGIHDAESGLDLARHGDGLLWLIPLMMVVVATLGLGQGWRKRATLFAVATLISGTVTALLMNRERADGGKSAGLIAINITGWYWFGFIAAVGLALSGLVILLSRRPRSP